MQFDVKKRGFDVSEALCQNYVNLVNKNNKVTVVGRLHRGNHFS